MFIPVSLSSLLQLKQYRDFCVHSSHTSNKYTSGHFDKKPPAVGHVQSRSSPGFVQWHRSLCVVSSCEIPHDTQSEFDSMILDTTVTSGAGPRAVGTERGLWSNW